MSSGRRGIGQKEIPAMATISLKNVMESFKTVGESPIYQITALRAWASHIDEEPADITNSSLGYKGWKGQTRSIFQINYEASWDDMGTPLNPLNQKNIVEIEQALSEVGLEDAAVNRVQVLIKDPKLGELTGNKRSSWHLTLVSDPVDGEQDRRAIKEHESNIILVKYLKFKYRILNCRRLIDRKQELSSPRTQQNPVINWIGNTFEGMKSKTSVVQRIYQEHMGEYGCMKTYGPDKEDTLVLLSVIR